MLEIIGKHFKSIRIVFRLRRSLGYVNHTSATRTHIKLAAMKGDVAEIIRKHLYIKFSFMMAAFMGKHCKSIRVLFTL